MNLSLCFQDTNLYATWQKLAQRLSGLMQRSALCDQAIEDLNMVRCMLEALPLASEPFGVASNRLSSIQRYLQSSEVGAAQYELRLLTNQLKNLLELESTVEPRRRLQPRHVSA